MSARRPRTVIALWLTFVVAMTAFGAFTGTRSLTDSASNVGQSAHALNTLHRSGLEPPAVEEVLVSSSSSTQTSHAVLTLAHRAHGLSDVAHVQIPTPGSGLIRNGGRDALVQITLSGDPDTASDRVAPLVNLVDRLPASLSGVSMRETGDASAGYAVSGEIAKGLHRAEIISIPITLLILLAAFGALTAACVPLLLGLTSVASAMGAAGVVSQLVPEGSSTIPVVVLIGLAVGIDYSLFAIRRARAERRAGADLDTALQATAATVGRAILVAGATVIIGLAGLLFSGFALFTSLAVGSIIVVACAVLGSLTVLPATLTLLGDRVDRPLGWRLRRRFGRPATRQASPSSSPQGVWAQLGETVTTHPRIALIAALAVLIALAAPMLGMHTATDGTNALPANTPAVVAAKAINQQFPGGGDEETLVVSGHQLGSAASRTALMRIGEQGRALVNGHGPTTVQVSTGGRVAAISIPVPSANTDQATHNVQRLRGTLEPTVSRVIPGATAQLTGDDSENADFTHHLATVTPIVIAFVLILAFVLLITTFGSPVLAGAVVGLNLLSVGAAFGILTAVFQHTWAQGLLGFTSDGAIVNWLPLFAFVVLFGLSMDYTVLVLERASEARRAGASAADAAAQSLAHTGGTVTSAALVMVAVFAVFATLPVLDFKQMGVGLAAAIALDATIVRGIALPAALTLLGDRGLPGAGRATVSRAPVGDTASIEVA